MRQRARAAKPHVRRASLVGWHARPRRAVGSVVATAERDVGDVDNGLPPDRVEGRLRGCARTRASAVVACVSSTAAPRRGELCSTGKNKVVCTFGRARCGAVRPPGRPPRGDHTTSAVRVLHLERERVVQHLEDAGCKAVRWWLGLFRREAMARRAARGAPVVLLTVHASVARRADGMVALERPRYGARACGAEDFVANRAFRVRRVADRRACTFGHRSAR